MNKQERMSLIYKKAIDKITSSSDEWLKFLKTASKVYSHGFEEQVLIYGQMPDATVLLSFDEWNSIFKRRIRAGAKGIAVFTDENNSKVKHYFDIKHTRLTPESKELSIWAFSSNHEHDVANSLNDFFGTTSCKDFLQTISNVTNEIIDNDVTGNVNLLFNNINDTNKKDYINAINDSVNYMVLSRCNKLNDVNSLKDNIDKVLPIIDNKNIEHFGNIISSAAQMELRVISKEILKETKLKEEQKSGIELYKEIGRSVVSGSGTNRHGLQPSGQIRTNVQGLSQELRQTKIHGVTSERGAERSSPEERPGSNRENRTNNGENEGEPRSNRRTQRKRPNEMGENGIQHSKDSGGNGFAGNDIRQVNDEAEDKPASAFSILKNKDEQNNQLSFVFQTQQNNYINSLDPSKNRFEERTAKLLILQAENEAKKTLHNHQLNAESDIHSPTCNIFHITDDDLGAGTPKERFKNNIAAVNLLHKIEQEKRPATSEEQNILSKYVGWGGLSMAFDKNNAAWADEYKETQNTLSPLEYNSAIESTLTAFYTPPFIIKHIYKALSNMGFTQGNILEPSCGTGNFIGMLPKNMKDSNVYGIEVDEISGKIAKILYPKANITINGFEKTYFSDNRFDVAIGNVPFGQYKLNDTIYDNNNFLIHDYFFAKAIDKVKPGGIIAFITSKGTMDKKTTKVRKYIAERAELLGAIRLPDNTFTKNAGTKVTSDIIFLQKRDKILDVTPDWVHLGKDSNDIEINSYFIKHPEMILGNMEMVSTPYGMDSACKANPGLDLEKLLSNAIKNINCNINTQNIEVIKLDEEDTFDFKNYSYGIVDGELLYKDNHKAEPVHLSNINEQRVISLIKIRDCLRELIKGQLENYTDGEIQELQNRLNRLHDDFVNNYGLINSRANKSIFKKDNSYPLLCSLEQLDGDGKLKAKSDIFYTRTINPKRTIEKADTALEALHASLNEKAIIDIQYIEKLLGKPFAEIEKDLKGVIYRVPLISVNNQNINYEFQSAEEYLSGNIREKLEIAKEAVEIDDLYNENVKALEAVLPKDLMCSEIGVRLGSTWIPKEDIQDFMYELLSTPEYQREKITVEFSPPTSQWHIEGKTVDLSNIKANQKYGTKRINAYSIIEDSLNLKDVKIFDYYTDDNGNQKSILNKKETAIVLGKQELIQNAFKEWIWKDTNRRERLTRYYNDTFNSIIPRHYNGDHLKFPQMNQLIELRPHQKDAIARTIYGNNTLIAHVVGAGKTYTMIASAMENKRLGRCNKSMVVVPNHIIQDFASDWLQLYPNANILISTEEDFKPHNRKVFCSKIATSNIDAVIIGHSQFEKIPLSIERQKKYIDNQLEDIVSEIIKTKFEEGSNFTVKQLTKTKKKLEYKLEKLNDQSQKDDVITFEELGCDMLFVDEADEYKNLFAYTKMRNVAGINQTEAKKSSDMLMKCKYIDEINKNGGIVFATGTPISNSMVELYIMQKYLQYNRLQELGLEQFDAWASTYGETVSSLELAPEGTGYRLKTRFSKFYNIPELMNVFREVADIQTSDMINLPVPKENSRVISAEASEIQKEMINVLAERAKKVRDGVVEPNEDNMLKIINEGRKIALDQRIVNNLLPDSENSKVSLCVNEIFNIWKNSTDKKSTQLVFCDLSTPKAVEFNVYADIKQKLINKGVPENEIAFIHDANNSSQKKILFSKVRCGDVRILMGSTSKMGAGTNVQDLIIASHDLDCPWRPRDLEQRKGRSIRQGNKNETVDIIRYVTKGTFDAYMYQTIENKQKFISQIMTSKNPARTAEDIDEVSLSFAEIKMLATGNPLIKEKMDLDLTISKLKIQKQNYLDQKYDLEDKIIRYFPNAIKQTETLISKYEKDVSKRIIVAKGSKFIGMEVNNILYTDRGLAGQALLSMCKIIKNSDPVKVGNYRGFDMEISFDSFMKEYTLILSGEAKHKIVLGNDIHGNIARIDHYIDKMDTVLSNHIQKLHTLNEQFAAAKLEVSLPFDHEDELEQKLQRSKEVDILISNADKEDVKNDSQDIKTPNTIIDLKNTKINKSMDYEL